MHPHFALLEKLFQCLDGKDPEGMASCYHAEATFQDIAFTLRGREQIHAMWRMIAETDLRASFTVLHAGEQTGAVNLVDDYTFRETQRRVHNVIRSEFRFLDGLIVEHRDSRNAFKWGIQALGPFRGVATWLIPALRRRKAMAKLTKLPLTERYYQHWHVERLRDALERFLAAHPDLTVVQLVDVLLVDQALEWRDAAGPSVEQYLGRFPAVTDQQSLVLELVYGELRAARALGLTVDADAYEARFPDLAESLRRQMEVSTWLAEEGTDSAPVDQPPSPSS